MIASYFKRVRQCHNGFFWVLGSPGKQNNLKKVVTVLSPIPVKNHWFWPVANHTRYCENYYCTLVTASAKIHNCISSQSVKQQCLFL